MKVLRGMIPFLLFLLVISAGVFAQDESAGITLEELYLSSDIEIQLIRSQAVSDSRDNKILALQTIRQMYDSGRVSADDESIVVVLESLAGEGVTNTVRSGGRVINDYPEVRRQAVQLLGQIGGPRAQAVLFNVVKDDPEPMVLSEAVYALGNVGGDNEFTMAYLADVLKRNTAKVSPDNNLAFACLLSLEKLLVDPSRYQTNEVSNVLQELLNVVSGNYIQSVRLKALDVIYNLRDASRS